MIRSATLRALRRRPVLPAGVGDVLVGVAEPAQVGDDYLAPGQQRHQVPVVGPVSWPAVQQHHRLPVPTRS